MDQIVVVVDRSGSMSQIKKDAEGGLNEFLNKQKELGEATLTLAQFDQDYDLLHHNVDLKLFEGYTLEPRGMTALFDAVGRTAVTSDDTKVSGKKIFVIVTDGMENASEEWTQALVLKQIEKMKENDWEFVFLAADESTLQNAKQWGMSADTSFMFDKTGKGAKDAYGAISSYTSSLRGGASRAEAANVLDTYIKDKGDTLKKGS